MRAFILIFSTVLLSCKDRKGNYKIEGDCVMVDTTNIKGSCGVRSLWIGMKFKEIKNGDTFVGLIHCPDFYIAETPDFFIKGGTYKILANRPFKIPDGDIVYNEYDSSAITIYKIDSIEKR
jgi:hypothetical protein